MILGRSTPQWLALLTAAAGLVQILVPVLKPDIDPGTVSVILGGLVTFLGVFIAFLANTAVTPVNDARLPAGSKVGVLDASGNVVSTTQV